jgi:hypothetical protein
MLGASRVEVGSGLSWKKGLGVVKGDESEVLEA